MEQCFPQESQKTYNDLFFMSFSDLVYQCFDRFFFILFVYYFWGILLDELAMRTLLYSLINGITPVTQLLKTDFDATISKPSHLDLNGFYHLLKHQKYFILLMNSIRIDIG